MGKNWEGGIGGDGGRRKPEIGGRELLVVRGGGEGIGKGRP
jgi:hypothetical protein